MRQLNKEKRKKVIYLRDSTAASMALGAFSSAGEDNLSFMLRNGVIVYDTCIQFTPPQVVERKEEEQS